MLMKKIAPVLSIAFATLASPVLADAPLGITGAEFRLGVVSQDTGAAMGSLGSIKDSSQIQPTLGFAAVNVAITENHGLQGDALLEEGPDGAIGRLGAHVFMTPVEGQKYGIFGMLADVDGESVTYGAAGVEGILAVGENTSVEFHGGIGGATAKGLDFIFVGGRITHETRDGSVRMFASYDLAEFDEGGFQALGHDLSVGLDASISPNIGAYASVSRSMLTGVSGEAAETTIRAGIAISFGEWGGTGSKSQPFTTVDPIAQLVRRGFF